MRIALLAAVLVAALTPPGHAQKATAVRILVETDGVHRVSYEELEPMLDLRQDVPGRYGLFRDGREVAIHVSGGLDGRFDPSDALLFYGERARGPHTRSAVYVLKPSPRPRRAPMIQEPSTGEGTSEAFNRALFEEDQLFVALDTVRQDVIRGGARPHWYWKRLVAGGDGADLPPDARATFGFELVPEPVERVGASMRIELLGAFADGVAQRLALNLNGTDLPEQAWDGALEKVLEIDLPPRILRQKNLLQLTNRSTAKAYAEPGNELGRRRPNVVYVDRLSVTYPTLLAGPARPDAQVIQRIPKARRAPGQVLRFPARSQGGHVDYDVARGAFVRNHEIRPGDEDETVVCSVAAGGFHRAAAVVPFAPTEAHLEGEGGDYVVITVSHLRPFLDPLIQHRRAQGLTPVVVEARALYDAFTGGSPSPEALSSFVAAAARQWRIKPRFVLIVGDADHDADWLSIKETIPARQVMTDYNGASATDALAGDLDGDGVPEIAVGRIPARSPETLLEIIQRTIDLETRPEAGAWRRRLAFVAGEARFSETVDRLLEQTFRRVLTERVPPAFQVDLSYASPTSPFHWPAATFSDHVVSSFNAGALAFTYVGHASPEALDRIKVGDRRFAILDSSRVRSLDAGGRNPLVALIACWTGQFDRPDRDALGELLLTQRHGAAAVIASSRVSHPYPDALIGQALAGHLLDEKLTVGEALVAAKRAMLAAHDGPLGLVARPFLSKALDPALLVRDHLYLYNLLGDPALRLPFAEAAIGVAAPEAGAPGASIDVVCRLPEGRAGTLTVAIEAPLGWQDPAVVRPDPRAPLEDRALEENHARANRRTLASVERPDARGTVTVPLALPALPGLAVNVVAYLAAPDGKDAIGVAQVAIGKDEAR